MEDRLFVRSRVRYESTPKKGAEMEIFETDEMFEDNSDCVEACGDLAADGKTILNCGPTCWVNDPQYSEDSE